MTVEDFSRDETAEVLRKKDRYRQLILLGKIYLSHKSAAQLVGPDCLYHLYSLVETKKGRRQRGKSGLHRGSRGALGKNNRQ